MPTVEVLIPFRPGSDPHHRTGEPTDYRSGLLGWCRLRWERLGFKVSVGDSPIDPFTRGHALNELAAASDAEVLILADADTVVTADLASFAQSADFDGRWYIGYGRGRYWSLSPHATKLLLEADPGCELRKPRPDEVIAVTDGAVSGCLILSHKAFDRVSGFDRRFQGWGSEDFAFLAAMDTLWGLHTRLDSDAIHLWHPHLEVQRFEQPHFPANEALCQRYLSLLGQREAMRALVAEQFTEGEVR